MLLSIIIPVYNVELYLRECLDSVMSQDLVDSEVIVVNDGSTDNSSAILHEYVAKYDNIVLVEQDNKGLSEARNAGMDAAQGEYLYFLDSDDMLMSGAVRFLKEKIVQYKEADVIYVGGFVRAESIEQMGSLPAVIIPEGCMTGREYYAQYFKYNNASPIVNTFAYIYNRKYLQCKYYRFFPGIYHEDKLFFYQVIYAAEKMQGVQQEKVLYFYRVRQDSICTNIKIKNLVDGCWINRQIAKMSINNLVYHALFMSYRNQLEGAFDANLLSKKAQYFTKEDVAIMRKGVTSQYEYKQWFLVRISPSLMVRYNKNLLSNFARRLINVVFNRLLMV